MNKLETDKIEKELIEIKEMLYYKDEALLPKGLGDEGRNIQWKLASCIINSGLSDSHYKDKELFYKTCQKILNEAKEYLKKIEKA